jgi:hypothetical protein
MVLADLGRKINSALADLTKAPVIDEKVKTILGLFHLVNKCFSFLF